MSVIGTGEILGTGWPGWACNCESGHNTGAVRVVVCINISWWWRSAQWLQTCSFPEACIMPPRNRMRRIRWNGGSTEAPPVVLSSDFVRCLTASSRACFSARYATYSFQEELILSNDMRLVFEAAFVSTSASQHIVETGASYLLHRTLRRLSRQYGVPWEEVDNVKRWGPRC